jgi:hypothetical protein
MSDTPPAVRILPMDLNEPEFKGQELKEVQRDFFLRTLKKEGSSYQYQKSGLNAPRGTRVLFQYAGRIIATAVLIDTERYPSPKERIDNGALHFDANSISVFDPPIGGDVVRRIWPNVGRLGRVKWQLAPRRYSMFARHLDSATGTAVGADIGNISPGRVRFQITRVVRDTEVTRSLKKLHRNTCQLCRRALYLPDRTKYSEAHHIRPLGKPHNGPDIAANVIVVCPNCHALCDIGGIQLSAPGLRARPGHEVGAEFLEYHNSQIFGVRSWPNRGA